MKKYLSNKLWPSQSNRGTSWIYQNIEKQPFNMLVESWRDLFFNVFKTKIMISIVCSLYRETCSFSKKCVILFFWEAYRHSVSDPAKFHRCVPCLRLRSGKRLHHARVHAEAGKPIPDSVAASIFLPLSKQTWMERRGRVTSKSVAPSRALVSVVISHRRHVFSDLPLAPISLLTCVHEIFMFRH